MIAGVSERLSERVVLQNARLRLLLAPAFGARVISLVDLRSGREWLTQGRLPTNEEEARAWAAQDAVFEGREAFGWDECLPTVAPCHDPADPAGPRLRDHGDLWGRPADVESRGGEVIARWSHMRGLQLTRRLRLTPGRVVAGYELRSEANAPLPYLWSMHPLLKVEPGGTVGLDRVVTWLPDVQERADWPVETRAAGTASKRHVRPDCPALAVARQPTGETLSLRWDHDAAPVLGLWLDFGGWPPPPGRGVHQVALEPCTSEFDDLATATASGAAPLLAPGETRAWEVELLLE